MLAGKGSCNCNWAVGSGWVLLRGWHLSRSPPEKAAAEKPTGNNRCDESDARVHLECSRNSKEVTATAVMWLRGLKLGMGNDVRLSHLRSCELWLLVWVKWRAVRRFSVKQWADLINCKRITLAVVLRIIASTRERRPGDQLEDYYNDRSHKNL